VGNVIFVATAAFYRSIAHDFRPIVKHDVGQALIPFD
jgi:hypothetical protein